MVYILNIFGNYNLLHLVVHTVREQRFPIRYTIAAHTHISQGQLLPPQKNPEAADNFPNFCLTDSDSFPFLDVPVLAD
jgi:hypothetical protein